MVLRLLRSATLGLKFRVASQCPHTQTAGAPNGEAGNQEAWKKHLEHGLLMVVAIFIGSTVTVNSTAAVVGAVIAIEVAAAVVKVKQP